VIARVVARLVAILLLAGSAAALGAEDIGRLITRALPSLVVIADGDAAQGSGFAISADGRIATSLHVIAGMARPRVTLASGETFDDIAVLAFDPLRDLAVLKVAASGLRPLPLGESRRLAVGQRVLALGAPQALSGTATAGILSAIRPHPRLPGATRLQTDAAVNPGSSGGPLLDARGRVIGVVASRIREAQNLNFAVPVDDLRALLASAGDGVTVQAMRANLLATDWAPLVLSRRWRAEGDYYLGKAAGTVFDLVGENRALRLASLRPAAESTLGLRLALELERNGLAFEGRSSGELDCETLRESRRVQWSQPGARATLAALDRIEVTFAAPTLPGADGGCEPVYRQERLVLVPAGTEAVPPTGEAEYLDTVRARRLAETQRRERLRANCREVRALLQAHCTSTRPAPAEHCRNYEELAAVCTREAL
jgi:hypothetical protein